jgi:hypothetical protein
MLPIFIVTFCKISCRSVLGNGGGRGSDIGFAGGGLWYVMVPAAVLGTGVGYLGSRFVGTVNARKVVFAVVAPLISASLGAAPLSLLLHWNSDPSLSARLSPSRSSIARGPGKRSGMKASRAVSSICPLRRLREPEVVGRL